MSKADIAAFADKKWILSHLEILNKMYQISTGFQSDGFFCFIFIVQQKKQNRLFIINDSPICYLISFIVKNYINHIIWHFLFKSRVIWYLFLQSKYFFWIMSPHITVFVGILVYLRIDGASSSVVGNEGKWAEKPWREVRFILQIWRSV